MNSASHIENFERKSRQTRLSIMPVKELETFHLELLESMAKSNIPYFMI
jgi:hypothetical protein